MAANCVGAVFRGGELCRRCVLRRRIEVAEMKVGEMCALNSTDTFINDLPNASSLLHFLLFADDTNIFTSHKSLDKLFQLMNQELEKVHDWFRINKLSLNIKKDKLCSILFSS